MPAKAVDEPHRQAARDDRLSLVRCTQGTRQGLEPDRLRHEADGPGAQAEDAEIVVVGRAEHDDPALRMLLQDPLGRVETIGTRHDQVHHDYVGPVVERQLRTLTTVARLGDDRYPGVLQRVADDPPRERIIVHDDHAQPLAGVARRLCRSLDLHGIPPDTPAVGPAWGRKIPAPRGKFQPRGSNACPAASGLRRRRLAAGGPQGGRSGAARQCGGAALLANLRRRQHLPAAQLP